MESEGFLRWESKKLKTSFFGDSPPGQLIHDDSPPPRNVAALTKGFLTIGFPSQALNKALFPGGVC